MTKKLIKNYEIAVQALAEAFAKKYYDKDYDIYWVGDEIGEALHINDEYWGVDRIVEALKENPTEEQLFDFYYYEIECRCEQEEVGINFRSFLKMFGDVEIYKKYKNGNDYRNLETKKIHRVFLETDSDDEIIATIFDFGSVKSWKTMEYPTFNIWYEEVKSATIQE